ncbi:uncharacterized protein LOC113371316 [Ctenocephalides felis]|uniref:uncharacterized protein LOC113371316 n=1 Tax=Ctenocephalides felis TaxID=7515 RepID=UPI000E6E1B73|nr:uncharacterized protein LOC113371316 [Ctenocephalides felis]
MKKKSRIFPKPNALLIRPTEKVNYSEILRRIKHDVPDDKVNTTVEKINKTRNGDLLITISKKSEDKGQGLQQIIAGVLKDEAEVIYKGHQETIEIRDIDDETSKIDIQIALQKATGGACNTPAEEIRLRKAYRGTQIATVALPAAVVHDLLKASSKIRIGWVNCQIKIIKKPIRCFKCWLFGHYGSQCKSEVNRTNLCFRCGQDGHKIANCINAAKCALCAENGNSENVAHHAGTHRCPLYREAIEKIMNAKA